MSKAQLLIILAHIFIGGMIVTAASVLGALHDLTPDAVTAIYGTAVGLVGGSATAVGTIGGVLNGKVAVPADKLTTPPAQTLPAAPPPPPTT